MGKLFVFILFMNISSVSASEYQIRFDPRHHTIQVDGCLDKPTRYLTTGTSDSWRNLTVFHQNGKTLPPQRRIRLGKNDGLCFQYQVDLNRLNNGRIRSKVHHSWLLDNTSWLWLPIEDQTLVLSFEQSVSAPWTRIGKNQYQLHTGSGFIPSRLAIGELIQRDIPIGSNRLRASLVGQFNSQQQTKIWHWLRYNAQGIAGVFGHLPQPSTQVIVTNIGHRSGPVPWAEVQRGGQPAVHLFVDPDKSLVTFLNDWTASHEMSHLFLPKIHWSDKWLSEGLASYYQNIARVWAGQLSESEGKKKLTAGFDRGRRAAGITALQYADKTMHTYWGGAAIFMLADLRLRQRPAPTTLAQTLKKLSYCCLDPGRVWSAEQLMKKLDHLSQSHIFTDLLHNEVNTRQFPLSQAQLTAPETWQILTPLHRNTR